jgi:hypothetical protein
MAASAVISEYTMLVCAERKRKGEREIVILVYVAYDNICMHLLIRKIQGGQSLRRN